MQSDLQNESVHTLKILFLGDAQVGKTSILSRMKGENLTETYTPTIAIDFSTLMFPLDTKKVKLQIWEIAGQKKFGVDSTFFSRIAKGIILVFDITNRESFKNIENWDADFNQEEVTKTLIGNKTDLQNREVSYEEAKKYAESKGMHYMETSAKTNNKDDIFYGLTNMINVLQLQLKKNECEAEGNIRLKTGGIKKNMDCFSQL